MPLVSIKILNILVSKYSSLMQAKDKLSVAVYSTDKNRFNVIQHTLASLDFMIRLPNLDCVVKLESISTRSKCPAKTVT